MDAAAPHAAANVVERENQAEPHGQRLLQITLQCKA